MSWFIDHEASCHECNDRLVLVRYVQVCPTCDHTEDWPSVREEAERGR